LLAKAFIGLPCPKKIAGIIPGISLRFAIGYYFQIIILSRMNEEAQGAEDSSGPADSPRSNFALRYFAERTPCMTSAKPPSLACTLDTLNRFCASKT
jgi:hypothetical protein